jgi:hypothetical protein
MLRHYILHITTLALAMCIMHTTLCRQNSFLLTSSFDKLRACPEPAEGTNVALALRF